MTSAAANPTTPASRLAERIRPLLDEAAVIHGPAIEPRYWTDAGGHAGNPALLLRPASTADVALIVQEAARANCPITPQGGRTGLVGGAVAIDGGVILSLERMHTIHEIDPLSMTMTVDAGVTLQAAQDAAEHHGLMLPVDLGARGSATIGGMIATNAGGLRVLRWGMMRDMVLGMEAVAADGAILSAMGKSIKDNAGYHWRDLIIGSEGTLAITTRAVLRLRARPTSVQTALVAAGGFDGIAALLRQLDADLAGTLSSFELMWPPFYDHVTTINRDKRAPPLPPGSGCYAIVEAMGSDAAYDADRFQAALLRAVEHGSIREVVIAQSERERTGIWALREDLDEPFRQLMPYILFDVSMALGDMPDFVGRADQAIQALFPGARALFYGHAGDGNLHIVVSPGATKEDPEHAIHVAVFDVLQSVGGSISAEHGIGLAKRDYLGWTRSDSERAMMRAIKQALDPLGILNPGKVLA